MLELKQIKKSYDEPTGALDSKTSIHIMNLLNVIARSKPASMAAKKIL